MSCEDEDCKECRRPPGTQEDWDRWAQSALRRSTETTREIFASWQIEASERIAEIRRREYRRRAGWIRWYASQFLWFVNLRVYVYRPGQSPRRSRIRKWLQDTANSLSCPKGQSPWTS